MLYKLPESGKRLLHILAKNFGRPLTVQELSDQTKAGYGRGFYANTYRELRHMHSAQIIRWDHKGRSAIIQLDPNSSSLIDYLLQLEAWKHLRLSDKRPDAAATFTDLALLLRRESWLESAWLLEAERSIRLNRLPILLVYAEKIPESGRRLGAAMKSAGLIDEIAMTSEVLRARLASPLDEALRPMLAGGISLLGADRHWLSIIETARQGAPIWFSPQTKRHSDDEIVASLGRYGYEELGARIHGAPSLPLETLVAILLDSGTARQRNAIPDLLRKNEFDPGLLAFLTRRSGQTATLQRLLAAATRKSPRIRELRSRLLKGRLGE